MGSLGVVEEGGLDIGNCCLVLPFERTYNLVISVRALAAVLVYLR